MKDSSRKGIRALSVVAVLSTMLSFFSTNPATAAGELNYLNNGTISFDKGSRSTFSSGGNNWSRVHFYPNQYDTSSSIRFTNTYGWGVTLTHNNDCYSGSDCGRFDDLVGKTRTWDYSGLNSFEVEGGTFTYGTIVETADVDLNGQLVQIVSSIFLSRDASYAVITTTVKNLGDSVSDLKLLINNYDGYVERDSDYRSTRGNIQNGIFVPLTDTNQSSNAVLEEALEFNHIGKDYGAILVAGLHQGALSSVLDEECCDSESVAFNPQSQLTQADEDGQYAVINQLPTLGAGETYTLKWVFGGARYSTLMTPAFLNEVSAAIEMPAVKAKAPVMLRQTYNLSFDQSQYGSDTLSDPDGQLRKTIDSINAKYGNLLR